MGEPMSIGRRSAIPAEYFRVFRELLRLADTVGGIFPEFGFSASGGDGDDGFSVGGIPRFAEADCGIARDFYDATAGGCGQGEDFSARGEDGGATIRRDVSHGEVVERLLDPVVVELVKIGDERDGDDRVLIRFEVEQPEVGSALVDDPFIGEGSGLHVKASMMSELL